MKSEFNYDGVTTYNGEIVVEDIQNTCLEVLDNQGMVSYLIINTDLGITDTIECGPIVPDANILPDTSSLIFTRYDASEYKSKKQINKFLQPKDKGKRKAVEVKEITSGNAIKEIQKVVIDNLIFNEEEEVEDDDKDLCLDD